MDKEHWIIKPCTICGIETQYACADCTINSGATVRPHVCTDPACRDKHERSMHKDKPDV